MERKKQEKALLYQRKREEPKESFFPFVEGEMIAQTRDADRQRQRDEMQEFVRRQRESKPPRTDFLKNDVTMEHSVKYAGGFSDSAVGPETSCEVAPHIGSRHPRFLSRAQVHMSRRIQDGHIKKVLDDKVEATRRELEAESQKRREEAYQWEESLVTSDVMREDNDAARDMERRRNAQYLRAQMADRKALLRSEMDDRRAEPCGYWGPEEKDLQDPGLYQQHCSEIIKQMEVNQSRRLDRKARELRQERRLIDNSIAEMSMERHRDKLRQTAQQEVLTTTWSSQKKIREAQLVIDTH
jgi:hypothetical protein